MIDSSSPHLPAEAEQEGEEERRPLPEEDEINDATKEKGATSTFIDSIKKIFAPCVGVVDAASIIMGNCRGEKDPAYEPYDLNLHGGDPLDVVMRLRERNAALNVKLQKRQGETLEFRSNGGFDDDVSAISAHTLEEMDRLRMSVKDIGHLHLMPKKSRRPKVNSLSEIETTKSQYSRSAFTNEKLWTMQRPMNRTSNDVDDLSNGVSTSGSESSAEAEPTTAKLATKGRRTIGQQTYKKKRVG